MTYWRHYKRGDKQLKAGSNSDWQEIWVGKVQDMLLPPYFHP